MILELGAAGREALFNEQYLKWLAETFGASGLTPAGVSLFVIVIGAVGLMNWSETFKVPAIWIALMSPLVAATLPVPVVWRLLGVVTTALAMLFVGLWVIWSRLG